MHWQHWQSRLNNFFNVGPLIRILANATGKKSQPLTAFTIACKGQFQWITLPMGLLGCPTSFQRLMKVVLHNISNVILYIDEIVIHTKTYDDHLQVLEKVLQHLQHNNLKIRVDKCFFGYKKVLYLGFTLMPDKIKPGKIKLKAIKDTKPPTDVKTIWSFMGLCNFFQTHIKNFAMIAAPLLRLTKKDSGYKGSPLPKEPMDAFCIFQKLSSVQASDGIPKSRPSVCPDHRRRRRQPQSNPLTKGWVWQLQCNLKCLMTTQGPRKELFSFSSRISSSCLGYGSFQRISQRKKIILFTDHKPLEKMGHLHKKQWTNCRWRCSNMTLWSNIKKVPFWADYLSRLPSTNPDQTAENSEFCDPLQPDILELQKSDQNLHFMSHIISGSMHSGQKISLNQKLIISRTQQPNFIKMLPKLSGSGSMTTNIHG